MQRRGQGASFHYRAAAGRIHEDQSIVTADLPQRADSAVKIVQIGAAAERDVLAIVDLLAIREGCKRKRGPPRKAAVPAA